MFTKKKFMIVCLGTTLAILLSGCGTSVEDNTDANDVKESQKANEGTGGIWEGDIATYFKSTDTPGKYTFTVQNHKTEEVELEFPSSQLFDYQILDQEGTSVYTYSADKAFLQALTNKTLKAGERLENEVDLTKTQLAEGTYKLKVWLTTNDEYDLSTSVSFSYNGSEFSFE